MEVLIFGILRYLFNKSCSFQGFAIIVQTWLYLFLEIPQRLMWEVAMRLSVQLFLLRCYFHFRVLTFCFVSFKADRTEILDLVSY